ncbi:beta-ketoacyl-[acyl-carrier-protein] synthase family protein [uncultured Capnocytophaga sp.]|uniref:beta-ketoacyl-[acyl-carrier-protein] synthase family protein n=1 Tax=uncultured Capnocytophaga sp. TaxID=159273 RepID=UPI0026382309|nr:beta-ketoacyl-[acyl-carrier-protein] synthase family protein [uncultured Capnocytophaga sp.]
MAERIVITAMGICSALGDNLEEHLTGLLSGQSGLSVVENVSTLHRDHIRVGELKHTNDFLAQQLGLPVVNHYSRTGLLGIWALKEAIAQAGLTPTEAAQLSMVMASSVGGMDMTERYFYEYTTQEALRRYIPYHNIGEVTGQIADYFGIKGYVTSVSTACSSSANAILTAANLLHTGRAQRIAVGGADALSVFTINGFNSLMILSDTDCTPFDAHRKGLNLGEAGAFLIMERETTALAEGRTIIGVLSGWGNANDAYHQTASSEEGEGAFLAMQQALVISGLAPTDIDYVNAHGTATVNNDLSESRALMRIFGEEVPDFSSTKPFTGHTLAVASAVEAIFSLLAIQEGAVWANLNWQTPMPEVPLRPQTTLKRKPIKHVLSNSFGFGGNCSTVIFSKANE